MSASGDGKDGARSAAPGEAAAASQQGGDRRQISFDATIAATQQKSAPGSIPFDATVAATQQKSSPSPISFDATMAAPQQKGDPQQISFDATIAAPQQKGDPRQISFDATIAASQQPRPSGSAGREADLAAKQQAGRDDDTLSLAPPPTPDQEHAAEFPAGWDRYQYLGFLGEGGMGRVYRAFDPKLRREVALKFVRGADPEVARQLLREAAAQAHIDHRHICKVYEVGEVAGRPYVAMQLVDGKTLQVMAAEMNLPQKVKLMQVVSDAMHVAHRQGLVHRDLKPSNILVERGDDGVFQPYVMDFGLARDARDGGLTAVNAIMGTPQYMSPEQARGDQKNVDRRSDVYSLGATLYAILAGRPPFDGPSTVEILVKVVHDDAAPLRSFYPSVPRDLETILGKAMEKQARDRYDSARALAEDLQRYLDGEPIAARPQSLGYRALTRLRKHRLLASVVAVAAVLLVAATATALSARADAQKVSAIAQRFGQVVNEIDTRMLVAYLLPLHDVRVQRAQVREKLSLLEGQMRELGPLADGPGHYALGRGYQILEEYDEARRHLELSWQHGYQQPEVAFALGTTWAQIFDRAREESLRGDEGKREGGSDLEKRAREQALSYLKLSRGQGVPGADLLESQIDYMENRNEEAGQKAAAAFAKDPSLFEAKMIQARVLSKSGHKRAEAGELQKARDLYAQAEAAAREALFLARSHPPSHYQLCRLLYRRLQLRGHDADADPDAATGGFARAAAACSDAVRVDPEAGLSYGKLGAALSEWAEARMARGQEPTQLADAVAAGEKGVALMPRDANLYRTLAGAHRLRGEHLWATGVDGDAEFTAALGITARGIATLPDEKRVHHLRVATATVELARARADLDHGRDPLPSVKAALAELDQARAVLAKDYATIAVVAEARRIEAEAERAAGRDPGPAIDAGLVAADEALALTSEDPAPLLTAGALLGLRADTDLRADKDQDGEALSPVARAIEDVKKAIAAQDERYAAWHELGRVQLIGARVARRHRRDDEAARFLDQAAVSVARALSLNPRAAEVHLLSAELGSERAATETRLPATAKQAKDHLAAARADVERALSIDASLVAAQKLCAVLGADCSGKK